MTDGFVYLDSLQAAASGLLLLDSSGKHLVKSLVDDLGKLRKILVGIFMPGFSISCLFRLLCKKLLSRAQAC